MAEYLSKEELEDYFGREYLTIYEMFGFGPDDYIQHYYKDEIWTRIIGFEDYYWISNKGRVWSEYKQKILKHFVIQANEHSHGGHWYVILYSKSKKCHVYIHRLLAIHFIPNPNEFQLVGHVNDNKNNNDLENLEWCTYSENMHRAIENGRREEWFRPVIAINPDTGETRYYTSMKGLGNYLNMSDTGNICNSIKNGWRVKGYRVFDANEFDLPPGLKDGDAIDLEVFL